MFDKTMIHTLAEEMLPRVTAHRRHLHMYPEVSFQEKESAASPRSGIAKSSKQIAQRRHRAAEQ